MGGSGREAAISWRKRGVLTVGFLSCHDCVVKATKLDKGISHPGKWLVQQRVYRAHANGAFKARECFLRQPRNSINPTSEVPCVKGIWVERHRALSDFNRTFKIADHIRRGEAGPC